MVIPNASHRFRMPALAESGDPPAPTILQFMLDWVGAQIARCRAALSAD